MLKTFVVEVSQCLIDGPAPNFKCAFMVPRGFILMTSDFTCSSTMRLFLLINYWMDLPSMHCHIIFLQLSNVIVHCNDSRWTLPYAILVSIAQPYCSLMQRSVVLISSYGYMLNRPWGRCWTPHCAWWLFRWCVTVWALWYHWVVRIRFAVPLLMSRSTPCMAATAISSVVCVRMHICGEGYQHSVDI